MRAENIQYRGQVTENSAAFYQIRIRLKGDVGTMFEKLSNNFAPIWLLVRGLFPIAESLAALIYPSERSSVVRLINLFDNELSSLNPKYRELSGIITMVWRHGLTHADEPPSLLLEGTKLIQWKLNATEQNIVNHLVIEDVVFDQRLDEVISSTKLEFNVIAFYNDLVSLCTNLAEVDYSQSTRQPKDIYNSWFVSDLPAAPRGNFNQRKAREQLKAIFDSSPTSI